MAGSIYSLSNLVITQNATAAMKDLQSDGTAYPGNAHLYTKQHMRYGLVRRLYFFVKLLKLIAKRY